MTHASVATPPRFSLGMELQPGSEQNARIGRYSDGLSSRVATVEGIGRFSTGMELDPDRGENERIGSFGDGQVGDLQPSHAGHLTRFG